MTFFHPSRPVLRPKQQALDIQDLEGLLQVNLRFGQKSLYKTAYTRVDLGIMLWVPVVAVIFTTAQFSPISWQTQAILWSALTLIGTIAMTALTRYWAKIEQVTWVVYAWGLLAMAGLAITDLAIFRGWPLILINLCPLWLGLSALGYILTGVGLRSRALLLCGLAHGGAIFLLPYVMAWQFIFTGLVMKACLILLAELQWDMRPPIDSAWLTPEQKEFNRRQHQLRQANQF
jgi:hypothetical protein